jgi:putative ABC transport system ATP-binding protein
MPIIELKNICKTYPMGKVCVQAVHDVSFSIEKGEFASISGPSGSGKSTLLNIMGLIDLPSAGTLEIAGNDVYKTVDFTTTTKLSVKLDAYLTKLRGAYLGFIFQSFNLIPVLNVRENVGLPLKLNNADVRKRIAKTKTDAWIDYLIDTVGLSELQKHKPSELSGGQRQRVAIARALVTKAPVILADEPTANLDSVNGDQILALMKKLNRELQTTFIFSTHDAKIVRMSDHVIKIKDGKIIGERTDSIRR